MSASPFLDRLSEKRPLMLDGAMGTMLQAAGLPLGVSPEEFCMQRPDILQDIHAAYVDVGADIITACTFGGNRFKLPPSLDVFAFNRRMAETAREVRVTFRDERFLSLLPWHGLVVEGRDEDGSVRTRTAYYGGEWLVRMLAACGGTAVTDDEGLAGRVREYARTRLAEG